MCIHVCLKDLPHTWRIYIRYRRRFRFSEFHGSRPIIGRVQCLHLHLDSRANVGYRSTTTRGRNKRIYDWYSIVLEALRKLLMQVPQDIQKTNCGKSISGLCRLFTLKHEVPPGPRFWSDEPLLRFCSFPNERGLNPLPPINCVTGTLKHVKSSVARSGGIVLRWCSGYGAGGQFLRPEFDPRSRHIFWRPWIFLSPLWPRTPTGFPLHW